ncbi:FAD-binding oxidoreductase [Marinilactibacillus sp. Marseille-P9653]|uniref:NAD(P)/FAD-dependent oxidoreductase n=1 Tax=Marinilactibacillus sp. Marseille-P9653 TaxID=2866583 RepID=UPI001CE435BD|nr:FAD-binding oxidoreductase [Marinilactibacillus sp. Marseille-P9653]
MTKKIAIVGAGVVGASAAYYLSKEKDVELTIFDEGIGQGTSAAAGIISPWLSKRRNQKWYRMVKAGAAFYPKFLSGVMDGEPIPKTVYSKVGTLLFKSKYLYLEELLEIGYKRREEAPEIGDLQILSPEEIKQKVPIYTGELSALWASGGAKVDGKELVSLLIEKATQNGATFIQERVENLKPESSEVTISTAQSAYAFDSVVLAVAAWLPALLEPLGYELDLRPQKGQLAILQLQDTPTASWPVIMPEGESDIIPFEDGRIVIGATHENDKGFDLKIDSSLLASMVKDSAVQFSTYFDQATIVDYRSGTRAYTSDFSPYYGPVPSLPNVYAASGLGSTGLTAGPLVGKELALLAMNQETQLPLSDYPIEQYIIKTNHLTKQD